MTQCVKISTYLCEKNLLANVTNKFFHLDGDRCGVCEEVFLQVLVLAEGLAALTAHMLGTHLRAGVLVFLCLNTIFMCLCLIIIFMFVYLNTIFMSVCFNIIFMFLSFSSKPSVIFGQRNLF